MRKLRLREMKQLGQGHCSTQVCLSPQPRVLGLLRDTYARINLWHEGSSHQGSSENRAASHAPGQRDAQRSELSAEGWRLRPRHHIIRRTGDSPGRKPSSSPFLCRVGTEPAPRRRQEGPILVLPSSSPRCPLRGRRYVRSVWHFLF